MIPLWVADINIGLLFLLAITSIGVYGIILGGWASNNKYSLMGGLRSAAQLVSYEVPIGLSLVVGAADVAVAVDLVEIVRCQEATHLWFFFPQMVAVLHLLRRGERGEQPQRRSTSRRRSRSSWPGITPSTPA